MISELVLRDFDCSLEFVFSLLLLQPFNFSPVRFSCNFQYWGCVILREIDFLLKICWSIPCLHPSWKVHTWIKIWASLNHRKKMKAEPSRLIPRKHTETVVLLSVLTKGYTFNAVSFNTTFTANFLPGGLPRCRKRHQSILKPHKSKQSRTY